MSDSNTQWRYSIHNRGGANASVDVSGATAGALAPDAVEDAVVRALLEDGSVSLDHVHASLDVAVPGKQLWRILLRVPGVNRDAVFAEVAKQAGFALCEVNAWEPPDELVHSILGLFGPETVQLILRAGLLPVEVLADEAVDEFTLAFATHDPTSQAARQIAASLGINSKFSFSPESIVNARISGLGYSLPEPARELITKQAAESPATSEAATERTATSQKVVEEQFPDFSVKTEAAPADQVDKRGFQAETAHPIIEVATEDPVDDTAPTEAINVELDSEEASIGATDYGVSDQLPEQDAVMSVDDSVTVPSDKVHPSVDAILEAEIADSASAADVSFDLADIPAASSIANPYLDFHQAESEEELVIDDVFADLSSAVTIIDDVDEELPAIPTAHIEAPVLEAPLDVPEETPQLAAVAEKTPAKQSKRKPVSPDELPEVPRDRVTVMLLHKQAVSRELVAEAVRIQREDEPKEALWRLLAQVPGVDRDAVYAEAASVYAFPMADISDPDPNFARLVMETFSEERREMLLTMGLLPLEYDMDSASGSAKLVFATHDPARPDVHRLLQQLKLGRFELKYAPESEILRITHDIFPRRNEFLDRMSDDPLAMDLGTAFEEDKGDSIDEEALEAEISRSTLINLFEATLVEATRSGASDIHIYPNANRKVEIHFRTDGRLQRWHTEEKVHPEAFLAVVKDNSVNVDRFERDAAQDGFIQRRIDDALIRFRVSVLPIATASQEIRAESIVIRVLDDRKVLTDLRKLGMLDVALERFDRAIRQPHGMVILTGPTGSGKSTTLVAALHQVVTPAVNVLTVEDPVEYIIKGVRQIKLSHKLNLEQALRSILRHDPDVVMVGEMRDQQTAELAIKLANTGHLTFSTLHTNDAPSAVSRLYKMGIEPFLLAYAINLVVAQRLLRNLCPDCKKVDEDPDHVLMKSLGFTDEQLATKTFYKPANDRSCRTCKGTSYKGRRAMCETLYFSRDIRHLIVQSGEAIDEDAIRTLAQSEGMLTLLDSAREIVLMGDTGVEELIRVTSSE